MLISLSVKSNPPHIGSNASCHHMSTPTRISLLFLHTKQLIFIFTKYDRMEETDNKSSLQKSTYQCCQWLKIKSPLSPHFVFVTFTKHLTQLGCWPPQWWLLVSWMRSWLRASAKGKSPEPSFNLTPERIISTWAHNNRDGWSRACIVTRQTALMRQTGQLFCSEIPSQFLFSSCLTGHWLSQKNFYNFRLKPFCCSRCSSLRPISGYVNAVRLPTMTAYGGSKVVPPLILKLDTRWRRGHLHVPAVLPSVPFQ